MFRYKYIKPEYRANLSKYKYSGIDKSLLSRYVLNHYWTWLVGQFPLWMAPNLITFIGFLICIVNLLTLLYYSPDLAQPCPNWVYLTFGFGLFAYQSLDAIDGKQARRTNSGGPLGELFDHGCDALNTSIGVLLATSMLNAHQGWWLALSLLSSLANFYFSTWEEYYTGTLFLSYFSGPVEGVIMLVATHVITSVTGPPFWETTVADFLLKLHLAPAGIIKIIPAGFQLNHFLILVANGTTLMNAYGGYRNVREARRRIGRPLLPALRGLLPFFAVSTTGYLWMRVRPEMVRQHMVPFTLFVGVMFGYTVGTMITAHVTKSPFPVKPNVLMILMGLMCLNANTEYYFGRTLFYSRAAEPRAIMAAFVLSLVVYFYFAWNVIDDICKYKGINCFNLRKRPTSVEDQMKKKGKAQ